MSVAAFFLNVDKQHRLHRWQRWQGSTRYYVVTLTSALVDVGLNLPAKWKTIAERWVLKCIRISVQKY